MGCSRSLLRTHLFDGFTEVLDDISSASSSSHLSVAVDSNKCNPYNSSTTIIPCNGNTNLVYTPDLLLSALISNKDQLEVNKDLKKRIWLTIGLISEIQSFILMIIKSPKM